MIERFAVDTEPHPLFPVYSAGNFGEVAPQRLSIAAWSLIGDPVERACRSLARRLWPAATWATGSRYVFVGYFGCRPYHNLSAYCHMACEIPGMTAEDVCSAYFEEAPVPRRPRGVGADRLGRLAALGRMAREAATSRARIAEIEGRVVAIEDDARAALAGDDAFALGRVWDRASAALEEVWYAHYGITLVLVPLLSWQRSLGHRAAPYWSELESWLNRPEELVWAQLRDAAREGLALGPGEFLDRAFYEIADDQMPWAVFAERHQASGAPLPAAQDGPDVASVAWQAMPRAGLLLLPQLTELVRDTLASREWTKSLAMRCMHVFRSVVPAVAALRGIAAGDWPYLTAAEIAGDARAGDLAAHARRRRGDCERALCQPMPDLHVPVGDRRAALPRGAAAGRRGGRGVSPGIAQGVVVFPSQGELPEQRRILVCDSADADVQPLLPHVQGVLTARGSVLSHVSILAREYGIPAVVGHAAARRLRQGQEVSIDGSTGEVELVGS